MSETKLWCFGESGNSYKAALMLQLCGIEWTPVHVNFFAGETREAEWRAEVNEMGEAPVLQIDGLKLVQSGVILDYLAHKTGKFIWKNEDDRREVLRWILFDNHKFTSYIATLRFLVRFTKGPNPDVVAWLTGRVTGAMSVLDKRLAHRDWIVGKAPTIADLSLCGYLFYGDELPFALAPAVKAWTERIKALPGWKHPYDLMKRAYVSPPAQT